ncbi:MAG: methyltransferase domain-containing protein [Deltaproteobacteria bacterium]|uniref:Methyltransferase domain-containing protein n=1 Tax=Candidatus Zymogenus saltonus TaxID=2844893 RepID=A0A9D8KHX1_9DELT|nr:methyltransferase domain-containing protein [Candidatus Zymogenus saltonus]
MKEERGRKARPVRKSAADIFDKAAPFYFIIDLLSASFIREAVRRLPEHLDITRDTKMIEVCCGTGLLSRYLSGLSDHVVGVDISPKMIAKAKRGAKTLPIDFKVMDASALDFPDCSFNLVAISRGLHAMPGDLRDKVVAEVHRVTKSHALFIEPIDRPKNRIFRAVYNVAERLEGGFENYLEFVGMNFCEYLKHRGFLPEPILKKDTAAAYLCRKI